MKPPLFDLNVFWEAFLVASVAEMACLARTGAVVARFGSPVSVCLGTLLGYSILLLPVLTFGESLHRLPEAPLRWTAGAILIAMGLLMLLGREF